MAIKRIVASQREGLYSTPSRVGPEDASQAFKAGAILVADANGFVEESGADPGAGTILGVAEEDGENNGTAGAALVRYIPALPHIVFEGTLENSGSANYALLQTDLYAKHGVFKDSTTGLWYIDKGETTATAVIIVGFIDPVATVHARVLFQFLAARTIYG